MEKKENAKQRYKRLKVRQIKLDCTITAEADILEKLDSVPNKAGYIKALIRADIAREQSEE